MELDRVQEYICASGQRGDGWRGLPSPFFICLQGFVTAQRR